MADAEITIHDQIEQQFSDYYEDELSAAERTMFDEHLASCPDCTVAFNQFRNTVEAIAGLGKMAAPTGFEKDVEASIAKRSAGRFFANRKLTDRLPLTIIAFSMIVLGMILYLLLRSSETGSLKTYEPDPVDPVDPSILPQPR